ncbi:MAG: hypothetical protein SFY66_03525 [Oculatellaceae cyanobacterium bins.114]|nr:hypothetical protein [Oculatellaceae cyanobacterium bins.114]
MKDLPLLWSERLIGSQLFPFKFWFNGQVRDGLRCQNNLFHLHHTFSLSQRDKAYELACELQCKGIKAAITCSGKEYRLWTDLQSSTSLTSDRLDSESSPINHSVAQPTHSNQHPSQLTPQFI